MGESTQFTEEAARRARIYWEQAKQDQKSAKQKMRAGEYLESAFLGLQATLNGLSAVCRLHGHFQLPASSPQQLLALCREADRCFDFLEGACQALEEAGGRNPFGPQPSSSESKEACLATLKNCEEVIAAVRAYLKTHRKRFFAP